MKITHISYGKNINKSKIKRLQQTAAQLGPVRARVWHQFGAAQSKNYTFREIRNIWVKNNLFPHIPARLRNETLRDTFQDILAYKAAALVEVTKAIYKNYPDKEDRKLYRKNLRNGNKKEVSYQHRLVRRYFKHGKTNVNNQIILDPSCYTSFTRRGQAWISVMSFERNKRICIPLKGSRVPEGTLRLIIKDNKIEIHYAIEAELQCNSKPCGEATLGVDKGYTEVYTTSEGERYGQQLGSTLTQESDLLKVKYQRRNKIKAVLKKHNARKNKKKAKNIQKHNLGRKKLDKRKHRHTRKVRQLVFNATHRLFDKAGTVICEDLAWSGKARAKSRSMRRRLSGWIKGLIETSLNNISKRRSAFVVHVNAAYTSQVHSPCGAFGERKGDVLYCTECGVVCDSDVNSAINILERSRDVEINLYTKFTKVKEILKNRYSERLLLDNPDSSCGVQAPVNGERITEMNNY